MNPEAALRAAGFALIAGVDEAGRGAYAGPLVIASVILDPKRPLDEVGDSKSFTEQRRAELAIEISEQALAYTIITIDSQEVDAIGLHQANLSGMRRAINALSITPDYIITDGYHVQGLDTPSIAMWRADQVSDSVGAASILAKNHRDQLMISFDEKYPEYGFAKHKGYGTADHQRALEIHGVLPIHRRTFAPVARLLSSK
jgi:ribonuclease HII